ncbi:N-acetylmuramoyl-L-alanine amidase [Massilibacterium senegalense]|uniref:N-acetylmuramoyl-L-alanine amidase n=1 Tax=Massilibacterium senegalense TaxID=1632858 RepID=UPI0007823591|nr:N-acetylmuramoyl-L-alanine amidase [Massilibacterium senegalense]
MNSLKQLNIAWIAIFMFTVFFLFIPRFALASEIDIISDNNSGENVQLQHNSLEDSSSSSKIDENDNSIGSTYGESKIVNYNETVSTNETTNQTKENSESSNNVMEEQGLSDTIDEGKSEEEIFLSNPSSSEQELNSTSLQEPSDIKETKSLDNNDEKLRTTSVQQGEADENKTVTNNVLVVNAVNAQTPYFRATTDAVMYTKSGTNYVKFGSLKSGNEYIVDQYIDDQWIRIKVGGQEVYIERKNTTSSTGQSIVSSLVNPQTDFNFYNISYKANQKVYGKEGNTYKEIGQLLNDGTIKAYGSEDYHVLVDFGGRKGYLDRYMVTPEFTKYHGYFHVYGDVKAYSDTKNYAGASTLKADEDYRINKHVDNRWLEVKIGTQTAYVEKAYVTPSNGSTVISSLLKPNTYFNFYDVTYKANQAVYGTNGKEIGRFLKSGTVKAYGSEDDYVLVDFGGRKGYINRYIVKPNFTKYHGYFHVYGDLKAYSDMKNYVGITTLKAGEDYKITGQTADGVWLQVKVGTDTAYVEKAYVTPSNGGTILSSLLKPNTYFNFYTVAYKANEKVYGTDGKEIGQFTKNGKIRSYGSESNYVLIDFGGRKGYVNRNNVTPEFTKYHGYFHAYTELPAYSSTAASSVTTYLKAGEDYRIDSQVDNQWIRIKVGSETAYVKKSAITPSNGGPIVSSLLKPNTYWNFYNIVYKANEKVYGTDGKEIGRFTKNGKIRSYGSGSNYVLIDFGGRKGYVNRNNVTPEFTKYHGYFHAYTELPAYSSTAASSVTTYLKAGEDYRIDSQVDNQWIRIKVGSETAYVKKSATTPSNGAPILSSILKPNTYFNFYNVAYKANQKVYGQDGKEIGQFMKDGMVKAYGSEGYHVLVDFGGRKGYINRYMVTPEFTKYHGYFFVYGDLNAYTNTKDYASITKLKAGEDYRIDGHVDNNWLKLKVGDRNVYVEKKYVTPSNGGSIVSSLLKPGAYSNFYDVAYAINQKVYSKEGNKFKEIGQLLQAGNIRAYDSESFYVLVDFGGRKGYINRYMVNPEFTNDHKYFHAYADLKAYTDTTRYSPIATLKAGHDYHIDAHIDNRWIRIKSGSEIAYVEKKYVTPSKGESTIGSPIFMVVLKKIVIDPGHGGKFTGARGNGLAEETMNLDLAKRVEYYLNTLYSGHSTYLTRTSNVHLAEVRKDDLIKRAEIANNLGADVFVSIHLNAGGGAGYEDYRHEDKSNGVVLQNIMHKHIVPVYTSNGINDRGKKSADFSVLRNTTMPAILTENGYMDNSREMAKMKQEWFRNQVAKAHADGIAEFLGLRRK